MKDEQADIIYAMLGQYFLSDKYGGTAYVRKDIIDSKTFGSIYAWTNEAYWSAIKEKEKQFVELLELKIKADKQRQALEETQRVLVESYEAVMKRKDDRIKELEDK